MRMFTNAAQRYIMSILFCVYLLAKLCFNLYRQGNTTVKVINSHDEWETFPQLRGGRIQSSLFFFFSSVVTTTRRPLRHGGETRNPFHVRSSPSAWSSTCFSHNFYIRVWPQSLHSRSGEKEEKKTSLRSNPASLPFKASDLSNLSAPARRTSFRRDM